MDKLDIMTGLLYTVGDEGIEAEQLCELLEVTRTELLALSERFRSDNMMIQQFGSRYFLALVPELTPYVEQLVTQEVERKLTQASLETLAIIAYNQPVTRNDIELMRGVNSDGPVRTLIEKGLILTKQEEARSQMLYTSDYFLQVFGLKSIEELPAEDDTQQEEMDLFFSTLSKEDKS